MNWLARLKKIDTAPKAEATEPTKPGFVGFVAPGMAPMQKTGGDSPAANDPAPDPDRWAWPHSQAMTGREIDTFTARLARFTDKGMRLDAAESVADRLMQRDREQDDRRLCMECNHLSGVGAWRCGNWPPTGVAIATRDAQLAGETAQQLKRCDRFM